MNKHLTISDTVRTVLGNATISADRLVLPPGQLDRATYEAVAKVLTSLGGQWKRPAKGFVFASDPRPKVTAILAGEKVVDKRKVLAFFPTPDDVADQLVTLADLKPSMTVLEPSAGRGALILAALRRVGALDVVAVDVDPDHVAFLSQLFGHALTNGSPGALFGYPIGCDFLAMSPADFAPFDRVLANFPFNGGVDADHIAHAWQFVKPGGLLVAITSGSWRSRKGAKFERVRALHEEFGEDERELAHGAFKSSGTMVGSCMVRWRKPKT